MVRPGAFTPFTTFTPPLGVQARRRRLSVAATSSASTVPMASIVLRSAALVGWLIKATAATEDATG
jgi:hypothetical protein